MRKTDEFPLEKGILAESAGGYAHTAFDIPVKLCLREIWFVKICNKLFGRMRKLKLLRLASVGSPFLEDLFSCGLLFEVYEYRCGVTV